MSRITWTMKQLQRLLTVLKTDKNRTVCYIILFLLSTGASVNEALQAKWQFIDIERRVWRIPATNSQVRARCERCRLNDSAMKSCKSRIPRTSSSTCSSTSKQASPTPPSRRSGTDCARKLDLGHVRIHDCGTLSALMLVNNGRTFYEMQRMLGHSSSQVTLRYSHISTTGTYRMRSYSRGGRHQGGDEEDRLTDGPGNTAWTPSPGAA